MLVETKAKVGVFSIALGAYLPQFPTLVPEFEAQYEAFKKTIPDTVPLVDGGMVTTKELSMKAGEKLSFLTVEEQEWVLEAIDNAVLTVTDKQAELFKNHSREKTLNQGIIYSVLLQKKEAETKVTLSAKKVRSYFPPAYTKEQVEEVIYTLLEQWRKKKGKEEQEDAGDTV